MLFVPGWCCDGTAFQPQFDHFAETSAVTALDLRGCGKSDRLPDGYAIPDLADDVIEFCQTVLDSTTTMAIPSTRPRNASHLNH